MTYKVRKVFSNLEKWLNTNFMVLPILTGFVSTKSYEEYFLQTWLCPRVLKFANSMVTGLNKSQISGTLSLTCLLEKCKWFKLKGILVSFDDDFHFLRELCTAENIYIYIYINYSREPSERFHGFKSGKDFTPLKMWCQGDYESLQFGIFSAFLHLGKVDWPFPGPF